MTKRHQEYFVRPLDEHSYKPVPNAVYEIQILNDGGPAEQCAYLEGDSTEILCAISLTAAGPTPIDPKQLHIPKAVIEAARQQKVRFGEYVNEKGEILRPSFLKPAD